MVFDNPVFRKELLCGLRSSRAFVVQFTYIALVCLLILPIWPAESVMSVEFEQRSKELFQYFTIGQFVVIALIAPAIAASAFAGEKERRVYDLIYTSPLQVPRVILGKLMAAVMFLLLLIVSSLPAMSVCFQLGGISGGEVINAYIFLLVAAIACGMIGLLVSAHSDTSSAALMVSYLICLPLVVIVSAIAQAHDFFFDSTTVPVLVILLLWMCVLAFFAILAALKKPYNPVGVGLEDEAVEKQEFLQFDRDSFPEKLLAPNQKNDLIEDGANPIYEKELRSEIFGRGTLFIRIIIMLGLLVSIGFIIHIFNDRPHYFVYYLTAFAILLAPAFSCGAFTREHERQTMDMMLASLLPPWKFVLGKFIAVYRFTVILTGLLTVPLLEWVVLGDSAGRLDHVEILAALSTYLAIVLATIALACAIAMRISMTAESTVEAMVKSYVALAFLFVGSYIVWAVVKKYAIQDGVPPQPPLSAGAMLGLYLLVFGGLVANQFWRAFRARDLSRVWPNVIALTPLALAGGVFLAVYAVAMQAPVVRDGWENSLGLVSPFLAAVQVTDQLNADLPDFGNDYLPSAFYFVGSAALFAAAFLGNIILKWDQVMYVEKN